MTIFMFIHCSLWHVLHIILFSKSGYQIYSKNMISTSLNLLVGSSVIWESDKWNISTRLVTAAFDGNKYCKT